VETLKQLQILQSWGWELAQGYLFAKPLNREKASQFLQEKTQKKSCFIRLIKVGKISNY